MHDCYTGLFCDYLQAFMDMFNYPGVVVILNQVASAKTSRQCVGIERMSIVGSKMACKD